MSAEAVAILVGWFLVTAVGALSVFLWSRYRP